MNLTVTPALEAENRRFQELKSRYAALKGARLQRLAEARGRDLRPLVAQYEAACDALRAAEEAKRAAKKALADARRDASPVLNGPSAEELNLKTQMEWSLARVTQLGQLGYDPEAD